MRVYVGVTRSELAAAHASGVVGQAPLPAFAVTPALRESYASGDLEELEYAAMRAAAESCLPKLAVAAAEPRRRIVLACDVLSDLTSDPQAGPAGVVVPSPIPWTSVVAIHADDTAAATAIGAAATAYTAAQAGDDDARFVVDEADGWELMWFATQEVDGLLD